MAALGQSSQLAGHKAAMLQWAMCKAKIVINLSVLHVFFTCDIFNLGWTITRPRNPTLS